MKDVAKRFSYFPIRSFIIDLTKHSKMLEAKNVIKKIKKVIMAEIDCRKVGYITISFWKIKI